MDTHEIRKQMAQYNSLYKEMDGVYHSLARHYGLSDCAFWILYIVQESASSLTQSELCGHLSLSKQTVNSALKSLEKDGYVTLKSSANNQKSKLLHLTKSGKELAQKTVDQVFGMERNAFGQLSSQERVLFLQLNEKYVALLQGEAEKLLGHKK